MLPSFPMVCMSQLEPSGVGRTYRRWQTEGHYRYHLFPPHGLYVPAGAFWGGEGIQKMADRGTLQVPFVSSPSAALIVG